MVCCHSGHEQSRMEITFARGRKAGATLFFDICKIGGTYAAAVVVATNAPEHKNKRDLTHVRCYTA